MNNSADILRVRLRGGLVIARMSGLWRRFRPVLERGPRLLILDLSEAEDVDLSGLQLLLLAERALQERGGTLHIEAPPPSVAATLEFFGLRRLTQAGGEPA